MFLPHFHVFYDLLPNRLTATWNPLVLDKKETNCTKFCLSVCFSRKRVEQTQGNLNFWIFTRARVKFPTPGLTPSNCQISALGNFFCPKQVYLTSLSYSWKSNVSSCAVNFKCSFSSREKSIANSDNFSLLTVLQKNLDKEKTWKIICIWIQDQACHEYQHILNYEKQKNKDSQCTCNRSLQEVFVCVYLKENKTDSLTLISLIVGREKQNDRGNCPRWQRLVSRFFQSSKMVAMSNSRRQGSTPMSKSPLREKLVKSISRG